jgi:hypothetical protein
MAVLNKFHSFLSALANGDHGLGSETMAIALTNTMPDVSQDVDIADLTEINYTNCSSRLLTTVSADVSGGVFNLIFQDLVLSASGGSVGPFRYIVLYNPDAGDLLIGYYDYGSELTLNDGETLKLDFSDSLGAIQIS